jgi:hypothetical protein
MTDQKRPSKRQREFSSIGDILPGLFTEGATGLTFGPQDAETYSISNSHGKGQTRQKSGNSKLAEAAAEILERPDKAEIAYLARELVQCTLPHRDPGDAPAWVRRNGNFALVLQPGFDSKTMESYGLPYGELPRLLLLWIVTEAVRTKKRNIKLGDSLNELLREIGGDPKTGRGKRGDAKRIREQMRRLFNCRISFQYAEGNDQKGSEAFMNMDIAREARLWWDFNANQTSLFESELVLGEAFFDAITANPVPIDWRAVMALKKNVKQSSFALDVYIWATYRVFRLQQSKQKEIKIPIASLKEQFGSEYKRTDNFKAAFAEALTRVQEVVPTLDYSLDKNSLTLRDGQVQSIASRGERPTLAQKRAQKLAQQISPKTREWFNKDFPLHDVDEVFTAFDNWRQKKNIPSENTDAHFKSFVIKSWFKLER